VHPRLCSGSCVRPLNFTVRRPLMTPRRFVFPLTLGIVVLLQGVAITVSDAGDLNGADTGQLLQKLKQCLAELPRESDKGFTSPCISLDVTTLSEISIVRLKAALGPPAISSDEYISERRPYEIRWAFYRLPRRVVAGGGPELQCVSEDRVTCKHVLWVGSE
jgi:hypothetical protein